MNTDTTCSSLTRRAPVLNLNRALQYLITSVELPGRICGGTEDSEQTKP
jgi:hypothetical protein